MTTIIIIAVVVLVVLAVLFLAKRAADTRKHEAKRTEARELRDEADDRGLSAERERALADEQGAQAKRAQAEAEEKSAVARRLNTDAQRQGQVAEREEHGVSETHARADDLDPDVRHDDAGESAREQDVRPER